MNSVFFSCIYLTLSLSLFEQDDSGAYKYPDPRTGEPINFNFLPTYADKGLGVMPHTVQVVNRDAILLALCLGNEFIIYCFGDWPLFRRFVK